MPRPADHTRVTLTGTLPNGEIFSTGFWTGAHNVTSAAEANAYALAIATLFSGDAGNTLRAYLSTGCSYDAVTVYHYTATTGPASLVGEAPLALAGSGGSGNELPIQCGGVITLETGFAGRRMRGRMYIPITNADLVDHQLAQGNIESICTQMALFFGAVNDIENFGPVRVVSQVAGASTPVTRVSMDSEMDIQRRRANRQAELRQTATVVAA